MAHLRRDPAAPHDEGLPDNGPLIRLDRPLQIKYVPQIKFYYDNTFEEMEKISRLINKANSENGKSK